MNEVEKMYENANVEREFAYLECHRGRSSICCPIEEYEKDEECMGCINSSAMEEVYEYPPFTAEKQIYLIQFLSIDRIVTIFYENQQIYISVCPNNPHDDRQICECGASWVEVLTRVINSYWLLFSEEERKQIKEILE